MSTDKIPDVRDGLTREQRVVLHVLEQLQKEHGDANVTTAMLLGTVPIATNIPLPLRPNARMVGTARNAVVCEYFHISPEELTEMLARLGARR